MSLHASSLAVIESSTLWASLCVAGWGSAAWLWLKSRKKTTPPTNSEIPDAECKALVLSLDLKALDQEFARLRKQGLLSLEAHLRLQPQLAEAWRPLIKITAANTAAREAANAHCLADLQVWWNKNTTKPWSDFLHEILLSSWARLPHRQCTILATNERHEEHAHLLDFHLSEDGTQASLCLTNTTLNRTSGNRSDQEGLMHDIFATANLFLWRASVRLENGRFLWRMTLPPHANANPIYKMAGALEIGGLWDMSRLPDAERMNATSEAALRSGKAGYSHDFRAFAEDGTHWLHEDVTIQQLSETEWRLVAVVTDITNRHDAELERQEASHLIREILRNTDILVWKAKVNTTDKNSLWKFQVQPSTLHRRIFGADPEPGAHVLYTPEIVPTFHEIKDRFHQALREGWPGYEHTFELRHHGESFVLHEKVAIHRLNEREWRLIGIATKVTPQASPPLPPKSQSETPPRSEIGRQPELHTPPKAPDTPVTALAPEAPAQTALAQPTTPEAGSPPPTKGVKRPTLSGRLLLMDDEVPIQRLAVRLISRIGLSVEVASNGEEAIEKYREALKAGQAFDIVMMDLHIPGGMGGVEAIGPLRELDPKVKAIVSSGASAELSLSDLKRLGFVGVAPKPYDMASLTALFSKILEHGSALDS